MFGFSICSLRMSWPWIEDMSRRGVFCFWNDLKFTIHPDWKLIYLLATIRKIVAPCSHRAPNSDYLFWIAPSTSLCLDLNVCTSDIHCIWVSMAFMLCIDALGKWIYNRTIGKLIYKKYIIIICFFSESQHWRHVAIFMCFAYPTLRFLFMFAVARTTSVEISSFVGLESFRHDM